MHERKFNTGQNLHKAMSVLCWPRVGDNDEWTRVLKLHTQVWDGLENAQQRAWGDAARKARAVVIRFEQKANDLLPRDGKKKKKKKIRRTGPLGNPPASPLRRLKIKD